MCLIPPCICQFVLIHPLFVSLYLLDPILLGMYMHGIIVMVDYALFVSVQNIIPCA